MEEGVVVPDSHPGFPPDSQALPGVYVDAVESGTGDLVACHGALSSDMQQDCLSYQTEKACGFPQAFML